MLANGTEQKGYITMVNQLLKCLQSGFSLSFCLVEKVFGYMHMKVVAFWTDPRHLQFEFFFLCVIVHKVDAVNEVNNASLGVQ